MALIELKEINKKYLHGKIEVNALSDINISINESEFMSFWGPSGSGKTSLLNIIGLIDKPCSGDVWLMQKRINGEKEYKLASLRNHHIGFVFQDFNLIEVLTALENVMFPLQIRGVSDSIVKEKALMVLEQVGIAHLAKRRPREMSGGQQQRVAIARALVTDPKIILADEPTANLDSHTGEVIVDLMSELNEEKGVTFVFSTHDQRIVDGVKRKIKLEDGRIVEDVQ